MIENFTSEQFEGALPAGKWRRAGTRDGQLVYAVAPYADVAFVILIWSSIKAGAEASTATAGNDSIRAVIARQEGAALVPWGGKNVRWIDRRPKWQARLLKALRALAHQINWIRSVPCPHCGSELVPQTAGTDANKGRAFVACKNGACPGKPDPKKDGFFAWCEDEAGNPRPPSGAKPAPVVPADAPSCPVCHAGMVRQWGGKGWKCSKAGRWDKIAGRFSGCGGVLWDVNLNGSSPDPTDSVQPPAPARPGINLAEAKRLQRELAHDGSEASAIGNTVGRTEGMTPPPAPPAPAVVGFTLDASKLRAEVKRALAFADEGDADEAATILRSLLRK